jgi:hypothetical protein
MRSLLPRRLTESRPARATEATIDQLVATGAAGVYGIDPIDGDTGYVRVGQTGRAIPVWTREKVRAYSVAAYRSNPLARAIIDTYVAFAVGDSGLTVHCPVPEVMGTATGFWHDPRVNMAGRQELFVRDHLIHGETLLQMLVGETTGVCRLNPIDCTRIVDVEVESGNVLWPAKVHISQLGADDKVLSIAQVDDVTGLRTGETLFWPSFKALLSDQRGDPFLMPIIDQLDDYDTVLSNLVDRTALARYLVWDVTLKGQDQPGVDEWIKKRGGLHVPRSGTIEVHNDAVEWKPQSVTTGAAEDSVTASSLMTNIAGGAGLGKTWLAEPDGANRATSLSMAEPIRRRVGSVQNIWLGYQTELLRYVVDQAVAARMLEPMVSVPRGPGDSEGVEIPASQSVTVHGPEVAAAESQVTAQVLVALAQSLTSLVVANVMTPAAAKVAAKKAWEQFVGVPYTPDLDRPDGSKADDLAELIDKAVQANALKLNLKLA